MDIKASLGFLNCSNCDEISVCQYYYKSLFLCYTVSLIFGIDLVAKYEGGKINRPTKELHYTTRARFT